MLLDHSRRLWLGVDIELWYNAIPFMSHYKIRYFDKFSLSFHSELFSFSYFFSLFSLSSYRLLHLIMVIMLKHTI